MSYELSQRPLMIGQGVSLKNRVYFAPMGIDLATSDGSLSEEMLSFYQHVIDGGCAMVVLGNSSIAPSTRLHARGLCLHSHANVEKLAPLVEYGRQRDCPVVVQLQHYGAQGGTQISGQPLLCPSRSALSGSRGAEALEMSVEDIDAVCDQFAQAALRARQAGARMVQLQASNGYLLSSFLSPWTNHRHDAYGGSPLKRARFLLEVIDRIHRVTAGELEVSVRLGIDDCVGANGQQPELLQDVVAALENAGTSAIMCSITIKETFRYMLSAHPTIQQQFVEGVRLIKSFTSLPVGYAGFIGSLQEAENQLQLGHCDLIGMSRALFADNDLINKSLAGHEDKVQQCRFDGNCFRDKSNPQLDRVYCCVNEHYKRPAHIHYGNQ